MNNKRTWIEKMSDFISGKGFYLVVLICVAAIALSGFYLVQGVRGGLEDTLDQPVSGSASIADEPSAKPSPSASVRPSAAPSARPSQQQPAATAAATPAPSEEPSAALVVPPSAAPTVPAVLVFTWPVNGTVIADYSVDALAYSETMGDWRVHEGMDLAVSLGTQVMATADGTVIAVYDDHFMGTTVEIDHGNGLVSVYSNLAEVPTVMVDAKVSTGSVIGSVGATAASESGRPAHLHFTMFQDGKPIDPSELLP